MLGDIGLSDVGWSSSIPSPVPFPITISLALSDLYERSEAIC